jgi:AAA family ATP:ADP antiporter
VAVIEVREGEGRLVIALGSLNFLVVLAYTLARVARDGFLLSHLAARSLPYVSVALAAFMLLVSAGAGRLTRGASAGQGLARIAVVTGVTLLGFSAWFRFGGGAAAVAFYLWTGAYGLLLLSQFWSLANEQIDAGQARRLFGLVGAGGVAGGLAAEWRRPRRARAPPADLLIAIAVLHFIVAIVVARGVPRDEGGAAVNAVVDEDLRAALRRPYVRLLVLGSLVGAVTSGVLDYQFKVTVQQRAAGAAGLTALLGLYYGAQNLLALVAQLGLSRLLFARLGARRVGASLPAGVLAGSALTAVAPGLVPVVVTRSSTRACVRPSRTSDEFSYFALLDTTRRPVKRFVDGTIARTGDGRGTAGAHERRRSGERSRSMRIAAWPLSRCHRQPPQRRLCERGVRTLDRMLVGARRQGRSRKRNRGRADPPARRSGREARGLRDGSARGHRPGHPS